MWLKKNIIFVFNKEQQQYLKPQRGILFNIIYYWFLVTVTATFSWNSRSQIIKNNALLIPNSG